MRTVIGIRYLIGLISAVSSFANPVALAYFAYLVEQHPSEMVPQLIDRITNQGSKPTVDPLLYGMFPRPSQL